MDDRAIQDEVLQELDWEPNVDAAEIGVTVHDGVVTLSGEVKSYVHKQQAEKAAMRVRGVRALANDLEVHMWPTFARNDAQIAQDARTALDLNISVPAERVDVVVSDGIVTLKGEVEWDYQRQAAATSVRALSGVRGVMNQIEVTPRIKPTDLKAKITAAFHRSAQLDAESVKVSVDGGRVTLEGEVSSWAERRAAENTAWAAPGVRGVSNRITVATKALAF